MQSSYIHTHIPLKNHSIGKKPVIHQDNLNLLYLIINGNKKKLNLKQQKNISPSCLVNQTEKGTQMQAVQELLNQYPGILKIKAMCIITIAQSTQSFAEKFLNAFKKIISQVQVHSKY